MEKQMLKDAMRKFHSTRKMASALKTSHSTIVRKLKKYELTLSIGA
jgi:transcriptional regulator of aroF, aroG, tyrA and aromatic amino acid transport